MSHIPAIKDSHSILNRPICLPIKIILYPFIKIIEAITGFITRLGFFSMGEWSHSWHKKKLVDLYKGGLYDTHNRAAFDPVRFKMGFTILENIGGIRMPTLSKDGTSLDTMLLRYQDVIKKITENGGKIVNLPVSAVSILKKEKEYETTCTHDPNSPTEYVDIILEDKTTPNPKWNDFSKNTLQKLGMEQAILQLENGEKVRGLIVKHWDTPHSPTEDLPTPKCIIRCNAPTESYPMGKRDALRHLFGLRSDVLFFDYPGVSESRGYPSEGSWKLAVETMDEKARNEYGYQDVMKIGFCNGAAFAAYHDPAKESIVSLQNPFNHALGTIYRQVFPAKLIGHHAIPSLQTDDPLIATKVEQNGLDTLHRWEEMAKAGTPKKGTAIIINTSTDTTVPPESHKELTDAATKIFQNVLSVNFHPKDTKANGHSMDILGVHKLWNRCVNFLEQVDISKKIGGAPIVENIEISE